MEFTAGQIAELLQGKVEGDPGSTVNNVSKIEEGQPNTLSFLANPKYTEYIYSTGASVVIVNDDFAPEQSIPDSCTLIRVANAYESFAKLLDLYNSMKYNLSGIEQPSYIDETATLGEDCYVAATAYIGKGTVLGNGVKVFPGVYIGNNVTIGDGTVLQAGVKIMAECVIGKHCTVQPGAVIGGDGFGFAPNSDNEYNKVPQIGNVILEDHVEIGANTTIDRATLGSTVIRKGVKLDNLIQVAHNVEIGNNTVIAAQTGVAGSTKIGRDCMIGGQVGIIGHLKIADGVKIAAQSGIGQDIAKEGEIVQGSPAFYIGDYKRSYVGFRSLPKLMDRISELEKQLKELKNE